MTPTAILETCLYAADLDAAEGFYGGVLGLEKQSRGGDRSVFFRLAEQMLLIFNPVQTRIPLDDTDMLIPTHGSEGEGHVCFTAEAGSIPRWRAHLEQHGIAIESEVTWPNGARSIYVRDPAGNSVEFAERKLWEFG